MANEAGAFQKFVDEVNAAARAAQAALPMPPPEPPDGSKLAILVTYAHDGVGQSREYVFVPEEWEEAMGPFVDCIPFSVHGNQQLWGINN